jgi:NAD-dependent DNA ligase
MSGKAERIITNRITENSNMLVPYYLMLSYAYYKQDDPIVSDAFYDKLARKLLKEYDNIEHYHKHLISKDALEAGSFLGEYPSIVEGALNSFKSKL